MKITSATEPKTRKQFEHLASTKAEASICGRCGAPILLALDSGMQARVEQEPILAGGELAILLTGRRTYVRTFGEQLVERTAERITTNYPRGVLHAEHDCPRRKP